MASKKDSAIPGLWHITSTDLWDEEYINEAVQAYLRFDSSQSGELQFGYVFFGQIDYRLTECDQAQTPMSGPEGGLSSARGTCPSRFDAIASAQTKPSPHGGGCRFL
jgi:hypothetical protein